MIELQLQVDWTEVDGAIDRLITAIQPKHIHNLAAKTAWKQVKTKYPQRWKSQVKQGDGGSYWQKVKQEIQGQGKGFGSFLTGLGFAGEPGFLTGTTYRSITAESDYRRGKVYPKGIWPHGVDPNCADLPVTYKNAEGQDKVGAAKYFKWGLDGLEWYLGPDYQTVAMKDKASPGYEPAKRMVNKQYGSPENPVDWLYLDSEDINTVVNNVSSLLEHSLINNKQGIQSLYRGLRLQATRATTDQEAEFTLPQQQEIIQQIQVGVQFDTHIDRYFDFLEEQDKLIQEAIENNPWG